MVDGSVNVAETTTSETSASTAHGISVPKAFRRFFDVIWKNEYAILNR